MRREIAVAGFVLTGAEWDSLDELSRAQLLSVALRRDDPWGLAAPPVLVRAPARNDGVPEAIDEPEPYLHYELVPAA